MLVKIRHGERFEPVWYRPEENKLEVGCKIYNSLGGWCIHTKSDIIEEIREDLDYDDFVKVESPEYDDDFSFMEERINPATAGEHYLDNRFLSEGDPSQQLKYLLEDQLDNEYTPIGICMDSDLDKNYGGGALYKPLVLADKNNDRIYVHINYNKWKEWADARSLQKNK